MSRRPQTDTGATSLKEPPDAAPSQASTHARLRTAGRHIDSRSTTRPHAGSPPQSSPVAISTRPTGSDYPQWQAQIPSTQGVAPTPAARPRRLSAPCTQARAEYVDAIGWAWSAVVAYGLWLHFCAVTVSESSTAGPESYSSGELLMPKVTVIIYTYPFIDDWRRDIYITHVTSIVFSGPKQSDFQGVAKCAAGPLPVRGGTCPMHCCC